MSRSSGLESTHRAHDPEQLTLSTSQSPLKDDNSLTPAAGGALRAHAPPVAHTTPLSRAAQQVSDHVVGVVDPEPFQVGGEHDRARDARAGPRLQQHSAEYGGAVLELDHGLALRP